MTAARERKQTFEGISSLSCRHQDTTARVGKCTYFFFFPEKIRHMCHLNPKMNQLQQVNPKIKRTTWLRQSGTTQLAFADYKHSYPLCLEQLSQSHSCLLKHKSLHLSKTKGLCDRSFTDTVMCVRTCTKITIPLAFKKINQFQQSSNYYHPTSSFNSLLIPTTLLLYFCLMEDRTFCLKTGETHCTDS